MFSVARKHFLLDKPRFYSVYGLCLDPLSQDLAPPRPEGAEDSRGISLHRGKPKLVCNCPEPRDFMPSSKCAAVELSTREREMDSGCSARARLSIKIACVRNVQVNEEELGWRGFLVDSDAEACLRLLSKAVMAKSRDDADIVEEAWDSHRTIVTCNRRDFLTHIRRFQSRENQKGCRDLWGILVVHNLQLMRERGLPLIRNGLPVILSPEALRWPGVAFLNLYVRLTASRRPEIRRFERCSCCERDLPLRKPWNAWYRALPLVGARNP